MSGNPLILEDIWAILRRRKWHVGIPAVVILLLSAAVAYQLPSIYVSTATILIEQQEIPQDLVASTITAYAAERVDKVRIRVMTRDRLWALAEKFDLYPEQRTTDNQEDISRLIREKVAIGMVTSEALDPKGRPITPTVGFTVSFANEAPEKAQGVTAELAQLFLDEDRKSRTENVQETSSFLNDEAQRLQGQISDIEAKIAAFKVENAGYLPESLESTSRLLETSQQELEILDAKLSPLQSRYAFLQDQLSNFGSSALLSEARAELAAAREKYSDIHPDVVRLKRTVATLEAEIRTGGSAVYGSASSDPRYLQLQADLQQVAGEIGAIRSQRTVLIQKIAQYESRIAQSPEVERAYTGLTRDRDRAIGNYREIMDKLTSAKLAEELERTEKGERFTLMGAATFPSTPSSPNLPAIMLLGLTFAFGVGVAIAGLAEYLDHRIHGPKELAAVFKAPPLAIIPEIPG
jgi:polysaccharide chain length determinant protein (PEP-CTERM system associated)